MKKPMLIVAGILALGGLWYAFRPELLFVNQTVNESLPTANAAAAASGPTALLAGNFRGLAHQAQGAATIYRLADGKQVLRLTNFKTSNGPALHMYLVAASDAPDNDTVKKAGFIDLGDLKGNEGDQNYEIPAGADLTKYRAASVWCARFGVNFAAAPLAPQGAAPPVALAAGNFRGLAHETQGTATIYQLADGKQVLRLTNFKTSNGPALHMYLVAASDAPDNDTVKKAGFIDLGDLKGNEGDQNYEIPAGTDLTKYRAASVWCARFSVNFGAAPLVKQ